jgi:hypothetical protein
VEQIEVRRVTLLILVEQVDCDFILRVGEGAHVPVVAGLYAVRVGLAELDLVLLWMVKFLHTVVGAGTCILECAIMLLRANFRRIGPEGPPPVLLRLMEEEALLRVVLVGELAGLRLEVKEVQEGHRVVCLRPRGRS